MKNWETEEFVNKFYDAIDDCSKCPVTKTCKAICINMCEKKDCVRSFIEYAMKEAVPVVKKMTMQEWANITGMTVAKDKDGIIYIYSSMKIKKGDDVWKSDTSSCINITDRVTDANEHDWTIPCYPEGDENE